MVEFLDSQEKVLQYILYDPNVLGVLYYGGVGGGKTFTLCKAAVHVLEGFPGSDCLLARDTRVNLEATTLHTMWGEDQKGYPVLPYGIYDERDHNQTKGFINWPNGGYLAMMGLDTKQNIARVKSTQWSFIGLEEVNGISWRIVKFLIDTRLRHGVGPRKILMTTNTDHGEDEVYKFFFETHTCDPERHCKNCRLGRCQFRRVLATTMANAGNLPRDFVERTIHLAKSDPRYHEIYMEGKFANVSGSIFPEWDDQIHVIDLPLGYEWNDEWEKIRGYDHGWGASPSAMLEAMVHRPTGTGVFWDEYYTNPDEEKSVKKISIDFSQLKPPVRFIHTADPSIWNKNQDDGDGGITSTALLFARFGITMEPADNDISSGIELMKSLLLPDPKHRCPVPGASIEGLPNQPYIYIARVGGYQRCPNLLRQIKNARNRQNVKGEENPKKWDPVPGDDHSLDCGRYIVKRMPLPQKFRKPEPKPHSSGWAKSLQVKKAGLGNLDQLQEDGGGFRMLSSM